ncbi:hypothetical protein ILT44_16670 [Microvirga sp. BT689]|uniref:SIR2 family protein n=1 Tax=Microvirga arvi TaxID=2778731 RepID=UPI00194DC9AF|nr:hypothetical protein [Microvirga arvi]
MSDPRATPAIEETDLVLTGADFGDAYLRSGWAARFLYDLVRRYHIVLVGYGAEDPPLKYLLNVISADRRRFRDLRTIYAFDSAGADGAQVTQAWLAKGIRPLLYEDDPAHANLYDTLAEWAAWVTDPQGWAERRLREVIGRSYTEASSAERGVLELLLTSPANCRLFKKLGGDFSWIRAIEDARPGSERGSGGDSSIEPQMGTYLGSLKAWLLDELETPAAMAWAVDRLTPRKRSPNDEADGLEAKDQAVRSTHVAGFSSEEISILDDLIERQSKDWNPESRRFWSLLSRAVRDADRGRSDVFAYDLVERLKSGETPDLSDIDRLARFLQPQLRLERPWRWTAGGEDEEATGSFDPQSLTSRSIHWGAYPDHREIVAALPDNPSWLALLLRALEAELDAAYRLAILMGWTEEASDLLHRLTNRVATETHWRSGPDVDPAEATDPDPYPSDHRTLVRVISGAWDRLAALDPDRARRIAEGWRLRDEALYRRLYLHALRHAEVFTAADVGQTLLSCRDEELWGKFAETTLLIVTRWRSLTEGDRVGLEERLRQGPPITGWTRGSDDEKRAWQHDRAARLLSAIAQKGGPLSGEAGRMVDELAARAGRDAVNLSTDDLLPGGVRAWYVPEGDPSEFMDKEGAALVAALEEAGVDRGFGESDHAAAFVRQQPQRTLAALLSAPDSAAHGELWRRVLQRLSDDDAMQEASLVQKRTVLDVLGRMHGEALDALGPAAVRWLEKCIVGRDEIIEPFLSDHQALILDVWQHLAGHVLFIDETGSDERFGPSQGERLFGRAYNTPAGDVTFVGLALLDRVRRAPDRFDIIYDRANNIETTLLKAVGNARRMVAARLAEWAHVAVALMPRAADELVLTPITDDEGEADLSLLDLHALYGRALTDELYGRLEPAMVREAKLARLSTKGVAHLVARLAWRTLDRLAGEHEAALGPAALRAALQQTSDEGRMAAADAVRDWFLRKPLEERARAWEQAGKLFFDQCWPLDVALRDPGLSQHLARLPALLGAAFAEGVRTIAPLIVPFELWDVDTLFLYFGERRKTDEGQLLPDSSERRKAAAEDWSGALDLLDAALGPSPAVVPYDLADWLAEIRALVPAVADDMRYKRLLRLTQG